MIKFVCASCGERLSVPEQHGGRKGVCPTCGAINRIPLKGYAETQPRAPIVARLAGNVTESPAPVAASIVRGALSMPALTGRADDPAPATEEAEETAVEETPQDAIQGGPETEESPDESDDFAASIDDDASDDSLTEKPAPAASLGIFGSPTPTDATPGERSFPSSRPRVTQEADEPAADYTGEAPPLRREWRVPRPVKIFLLMFVALTIVGGLYCALYFGIPALLRMLSSNG